MPMKMTCCQSSEIFQSSAGSGVPNKLGTIFKSVYVGMKVTQNFTKLIRLHWPNELGNLRNLLGHSIFFLFLFL